jgi:DnaK suppressor protein
MTPEERKGLKAKMEEKLTVVEADIVELKELTKPISPENAIGRVSRMDAINNKSINEASLRKALEKEKKLKYALTQINEPNFGICVRCKSPIQPGRLILMPESNKCVRCAALR